MNFKQYVTILNGIKYGIAAQEDVIRKLKLYNDGQPWLPKVLKDCKQQLEASKAALRTIQELSYTK